MAVGAVLTPLRAPTFRWFFVGEMVSAAGTAMAALALAFATLAINPSPAALGLVVAAWTVPMVGFMLIGGAVADRVPRALILRGGNLVQGIVQATVAVLVLTGAAQVWHLVVLNLVSGTVVAITYPAFHGMVPVLVPVDERRSAYVLISQTESLLRIAGPAVAGILVATAGAGWALAIDAATYFIAAGFLSLVVIGFGERPERQASVLGDFRVGWAYARGLRWVIPIACCSLAYNALISGSITVLGPVIAQDTIGSQGWGIAQAGEGLGLFLTGFALVRVSLRRPMQVLLVGFCTAAVPMVVLATAVGTLPLTIAFVVMGAGMAALTLAWNMTVQEKIREDMLSRIHGIDGFFSFVAMPVGQLLVGPLVLLTSTRAVELGSAALVVLVTLVALAVPAIASVRLAGGTTARA